MKAEVDEYDGCFSIILEAETLAEAAIVVRMGINATKELRCVDALATRNGDNPIYVAIVIGKRKQSESGIGRAH